MIKMERIYRVLALALCAVSLAFAANAQERVYVSTDKECYLAGENMWISVYCLDDAAGGYSQLSKVAYLEFYNKEGLVSQIKLPLKEGRGCGRLQIPLSFATGNYSIAAYTQKYGGASKGEFNGKIVTVFNTLSSQRVKDGVEVVPDDEPLMGDGSLKGRCNWLSVDVQTGKADGESVPVEIKNLSDKGASVSVSIYHIDPLGEMVGAYGYDRTTLLERKGDFELSPEVDYAGEVIRVRISSGGKKSDMKDVAVYMSAMGNTDDIYINTADEKGEAVYYTSNIYGTRDLVFEVEGDTSSMYNVEILQQKAHHRVAGIPVLKISPKMKEALQSRGMDMQIAKRFEADTIFNLMPRRENSFIGTVEPRVYRLDDYTRFPVMEEVVREFVKDLRIRKEGDETVMRLLWGTKARALVLLDGVPVTDHSLVVGLDPHLVKEIVLYSRRYVLNNRIFDGVVKFNTYKGDMGGVKLARNVSVVNHRGVQYPLAFLGDQLADMPNYPNFNNTIYWNPVVEIEKGGTVSFKCMKPQYKGRFRMVIEGLDSNAEEVYLSTFFTIE
jgi:hypothetical protein